MSKTKVVGGGTEKETAVVKVEKLENSFRKIQSHVSISASLETIWDVLTDYDKLCDVIPTLAESKIIEKRDNNRFRVQQVARENLPLGFKFSAKSVLDYNEKQLENLANGTKRDLDFKAVEGDFQSLDGTWSIEKLKKPNSGETTLSYSVYLKPKPWLPFYMIEGRVCNMLKTNLTCIKKAAEQRTITKST